MTVKIKFDASLSQQTSGACFEIVARDQKHAKQIAQWLRTMCGGESEAHISAIQEIIVPVNIEI